MAKERFLNELTKHLLITILLKYSFSIIYHLGNTVESSAKGACGFMMILTKAL